MKYLTPELLARYGSSDDQVADAAHAEWEAAAEQYRKHLGSIKPMLPRRLRGLLRRYYLHDATVTFVGVADRVLHLTLQLDAPPRDTVFLRYRLVSDVKMAAHSLDGQECTEPLLWLYDELGIASEGPFPVIEQRVLFSNGLELTIHFQDVSYSTARALPLTADGANGTVRIGVAG